MDNWYFKAGYSYGVAKNTVDPGSIAFGSWNNNPHAGDPNNPGLGFSANSPGHRAFATASYRFEYLSIGATTLSVFLNGQTNGNASYVYAGDLNGDGGTSNDLIYIPRDKSEMNFQDYSVNVNGQNVTFTAQQQADAWEAYIEQDLYLSKNRGKYAERGALFFPMVWRADLSLTQEIAGDLFGNRQGLQLRLDILNFTNLLNKDWVLGKFPSPHSRSLPAEPIAKVVRSTVSATLAINSLIGPSSSRQRSTTSIAFSSAYATRSTNHESQATLIIERTRPQEQFLWPLAHRTELTGSPPPCPCAAGVAVNSASCLPFNAERTKALPPDQARDVPRLNHVERVIEPAAMVSLALFPASGICFSMPRLTNQ